MARKKAIMTNAMRMLDKSGIEYELIEYEAEEDIPDRFGETIAEKTGINPEQCFKTLVAKSDKGSIVVACVPVKHEVDLKKLAHSAGEKRLELIAVKELFALTGYIRGGVSPIGMKKKYPTFFENTCSSYEKIAVSAGVCGGTLMISTSDLLDVCEARLFEN